MATSDPSPSSSTESPSDANVVWASICLRSVWRSAPSAPQSSVAPPKPTSSVVHAVVPPSQGVVRAKRYTPACTMVAECRNAETGVGASMALGSQTWKGSCADLVKAASRNSASTNP